ncbi:hypothetical protein J2X65_003557 [Ancylobacter sp. 3268]|uniref:HNH endonuclease signature motif containing protein n=1 Tax=Ancylobacter sp. 3268 TaxID=2817752 RepID=UPI0028644A18|nr:HNH endonuclease signature motif containing protein [Ancylobacter sp. 3268]MDR6954189.1 hypothetical protein [Ancylobacter sp. 3268]
MADIPPRPSLTPKQKLTIMARYCRCPGLPERGVKCGKHLPAMSDCEFDHIHARALGGSDDLENMRPLCPSCHKVKTNGLGGEKRIASAGSDKHAIAKARRISKNEEAFRQRLLAKQAGDEPAPRKSRWPSRPFPKRKKEPS